MTRLLLPVLCWCFLATAPVSAAPRPTAAVAGATRDEQATELRDQAERWLLLRTIDGRRMALRSLERAVILAPDRIDIQVVLARASYQAGFIKQARQRYERALALAPNDATARFGLAQSWRRDWLKYLERRSLDRAIEHYSAAGRLDTSHVDAWLMLSALEVERGDLGPASAAAERALRADRGRADAILAAASTRWRVGDVAAADSLFRTALSRLRRSVRARFEDFAPLATERDTMEFNRLPDAGRAEYARRFWREHDPDLATPENEAQLEYWARVAQAYFLYYDPARREWDERGEVYVRYGPPDSVAYNPIGTALYGFSSSRGAGNHVTFPVNVLVWGYRALGMTVTMHDRMLSERYELPVSMTESLDPTPDADSVARSGLMATHGLRGLFPKLPPGARALEVRSQLARFEGADGRASLFAGIASPGGPADSLTADLVVLDSTYQEVARVRRVLSPSACDASGLRVAEFVQPLPPGRYLVGSSVRGAGRRGSTREDLQIEAPDSLLAVSDLVVTCGLPVAPEGTVRLDANPGGFIRRSEPLVAYFEVYHLTRGDDGHGRFEYETSIRSARRDARVWLQRWLSPRREGQDLGVTRQDAVLGTVRRQYVSIPVMELAAGRYRLDITVRDVLAGAELRRSVEFTRE